MIFKFLLFKDIFQFKFLSRRGNEIYFFAGEKLSFLVNTSKKIFDVDDYYKNFSILSSKKWLVI